MEATLQITYSQEFIDFVYSGVNQNYYIGTGNPNAKILFVGKESAIDEDNHDEKVWYNKNSSDWLKHIQNGTGEVLNYPISSEHIFRKEKSWGKNTWSKYQKLTNHIFDKADKPYFIDFLEDVFTTEINDSPNKNTRSANKSNLNGRKLLFKESDFIQSFSVIVLACSNYIKNDDKNREIDEIFGVEFKDEYPHKIYNKTTWFFSHYNSNKTKLVIHTRQLSADVKSELLKDMAEVIKQHLSMQVR